MGELLRNWLFPEQVRFLRGARAWSITFRTLHLAAFGLLIGGHAFAVDAERLLPSLWLTILSGLGRIAGMLALSLSLPATAYPVAIL